MTGLRLVWKNNKPAKVSGPEVIAHLKETEADRELREADERERRKVEASGFGAAVAFVIAIWIVCSIFAE